MRRFVAILVGVAVVVTLAAGLLPPLFTQATLDETTLAAARAGSLALYGGGATGADAAALHSLAAHPNVKIVNMKPIPRLTDAFIVTAQEDVHTFMDGVPGLRSWFIVTSTQQSTEGN